MDQQQLKAAADYIRERIPVQPEVALILGSGLSSLAEGPSMTAAIDTADVPFYPRSSVEGHRGRLVFGEMEGRKVLFVQGRVHGYEGYTADTTAFPAALAHALGARYLIVTNAAGGINPSFKPGTLMWIVDHINMAFRNPLVGPVFGDMPRFPDMSEPYDLGWTARAESAALKEGIATRRGTYIWVTGPSYETRAEIRAFSRLGADAVGMSTVPEVLVARALGMKVLGISTITNPAAGLSLQPLAHDEVLEVGRAVTAALSRVVALAVGCIE